MNILFALAIAMAVGMAMTRLIKLIHLPNVTAYIVAGILLGPFCLHLVPDNVIEGMDFLSDIALAFIAFSTGEFFKLETLKRNGMKVVLVTVAEALMASVFVFIMAYFVLGIDLAFSIVLAALAASGTSVITHPEHIDRGYAAFTEILASLGAQIRREAPLRNTSTKKTSSKKQNHLAIGTERWYDTVI